MIFITLITTIQNLTWSLSWDNDSIGRLGLTNESNVHVLKVFSTGEYNNKNTNQMSLLKMKRYKTYVIKSKNVCIIHILHTWGIISHIHSDAKGKSYQRFQHRTNVFRKTLLNCHLDDNIRACMIKHYAEHSHIFSLPQYTKYIWYTGKQRRGKSLASIVYMLPISQTFG